MCICRHTEKQGRGGGDKGRESGDRLEDWDAVQMLNCGAQPSVLQTSASPLPTARGDHADNVELVARTPTLMITARAVAVLEHHR